MVNTNGKLGGTGVTNSRVNEFGTLAPGSSTESLGIGNLTMASGSILDVEIGGINAGAVVNGYDQLNVTGTVNLGDVSLLSLTPEAGDAFFILTNDAVDAVNVTIAGLSNDSVFEIGGQNWRIRYHVKLVDWQRQRYCTNCGSARARTQRVCHARNRRSRLDLYEALPLRKS